MQTIEQLMKLVPIDERSPDFYRGNRYASIAYGARFAPNDVFAEFGVAEGDCVELLAKGCHKLHLYDSFEGLPEAWHKLPVGAFACRPPELSDMSDEIRERIADNNLEIVIHKGMFDSILEHPNGGAAIQFGLVHMDADLYQSTMDVLERITIFPGQVFVFDEFYGFKNAEKHEQRAWYEFAEKRGLRFNYLARTAYSQVVLQIL